MGFARPRPGGRERRPPGRLFFWYTPTPAPQDPRNREHVPGPEPRPAGKAWPRPQARALFLALLLAPLQATAGEACPADRIDAWAEVRSVLDGDTVSLSDGRRIRMVGVNAPEVGRDDRPAEPFATAARRALEGLAGPGSRVGLRYDAERQDPHGRTLAHVFLPDGTNVQRELLARGLAASIVVPPNAWGWECYREAERGVRSAGRGIWGDARFRPTDPARLPPAAEGFWVVTGQVVRVGEGRNAWWLNLDGGFAVRIEKRDLENFPGLQPPKLKGRRIEVRGWVNASPRERWVNARHPAMFSVLREGLQ